MIPVLNGCQALFVGDVHVLYHEPDVSLYVSEVKLDEIIWRYLKDNVIHF